jgi:hypothetical protein
MRKQFSVCVIVFVSLSLLAHFTGVLLGAGSPSGAAVPTGVRLPDGTVVDQPGAVVTVTTTTGPAPGGVTSSATQAKGPGVTAGDASNVKDLSLAVPNITTTEDGGSVTADGGTSGFSFRAITRSSAGVLFTGGIIAVLAGVGIGAMLGKWQWGAYLIATGVGFILSGIVAESYPWVALVVVAVAGAGGVWLLVTRIRNNGVSTEEHDKVRGTLRAVVAAISNLPPEIKAAVKAEIGKMEPLQPGLGTMIASVKED